MCIRDSPWALFVILLVVAVLAFGTIFLFKKRMLQIRLTIFKMCIRDRCLKAVFRTYCMDYPDYDFYCTYQASRTLKGLRNHQLQTVAGFFGFELENHHHALADAEACAWIARQIL